MAWTTTQLLAHVRRVASLPSTSTAAGYTDADLLVHADAQLAGKLTPLVTRSRDEHGIHMVDVTASAGYVRLPPRVAAGRLRDVTMLNSATNSYVSVPRLEPEDVADWYVGNPASASRVTCVVQAGWLRLLPTPSGSVTLRISYVRTPSALAAVPSTGICTNITAGTPNVTFTHSAGTLSGAQDVVLLSNGDSLGDSCALASASSGSTAIAATSLSPVFSNTAAECARYLAEGVYLCPAGTTCVVPLPDLMSPLLAYRTAIAFVQAIGDSEASDRLEETARDMEKELQQHISERIEGESQKVRPRMHRRARGLWWGI